MRSPYLHWHASVSGPYRKPGLVRRLVTWAHRTLAYYLAGSN